jgi:hypothetical protein
VLRSTIQGTLPEEVAGCPEAADRFLGGAGIRIIAIGGDNEIACQIHSLNRRQPGEILPPAAAGSILVKPARAGGVNCQDENDGRPSR